MAQITPAAEDAFCEYLRVRTAGDDDFDAFCTKRPELESGLRALHEQWSRVHVLLERLGGSVSISERLKNRFGEVDPQISLHDERVDPEGGGAIRLLSKLAAKRPASTRYDIRGELGRGGMGVVYKVWDEDLRRQLAMKVVSGKRDPTGKTTQVEVEPRRMSRFLEEAQITGQLDHPGILPVHELGIDPDGRVYFTMRLVEGRELRDVFKLSRKGEEDWSRTRVLGILLRVCEAMAFAHSKGVIHRDIKPANIMVGRFGAVYVMDWGLAKVLGREDSHDIRIKRDEGKEPESSSNVVVATDRSDSDSRDHDALVTMDGDIVGTPSYMSPEQATGRLDELGPRSDVYSVGAMLYELLTGQMPYEPLGERVPAHTILNAVRTTPPWPVLDIVPETPPELVAICEKAMARDAVARYADMGEFAKDVRAYLEGHVVAAFETGVTAELKKWVVRNKVVSLVAVALVFVIVGSIGGLIWQQRRANIVTEDARDEALVNLKLAKDRQSELEIEKARADDAVLESKANLEQANRNKEEADHQARTAKQNAIQAQLQSRAAKRKGYLAGLTAADYSLRMGEVKDAKRSLAACERSARGWEWDFLAAQSDTAIAVYEDTVLPVFFGDFVGNGLIVTAARDHKVRVVQLEDHKLAYNFTSKSSVMPASERVSGARAATLAPGGRYLAVSTNSSVVSLWDLQADKTDLKPKPIRTFADHEDGFSIRGITISSDGQYLASCSGDMTVRVYDFESAEPLAVLVGLESPARALKFSPTEPSRLAVVGSDTVLRIWDWKQALAPELLRGHQSLINDVDWSPDGSQLATVSDDRTLRLWDSETGRLELTLREHSGAVTAVEYGVSEGEVRVVTGSEDTTVRLWDPSDGQVLRVFAGHEEVVLDVCFDDSGDRLLSTSGDGGSRKDCSTRIWDLSSRQGLQSLSLKGDEDQTRVVACSFDQAGTRFLTAVERVHADPETGATTSNGEVRVWSKDQREVLVKYETDDMVVSASFVEGDKTLAILLAPSVGPFSRGISTIFGAVELKTIRLVLASAETGEYLRDIPLGASEELLTLASNRQGTIVAVAGVDRDIKVIDVASGEVLQLLKGHRGSVRALAFSPDGRFLASGSRDKTVRVWNLQTGGCVLVLRGHRWQVNTVAFDALGERLASGSNDRSVRIWDLASGETTQELRVEDSAILTVCFSPSGDRVFTGGNDKVIRVFESDAGEMLLRMRKHTGSVRSLAFHPSGKTLLSSSDDGTLRIWESQSARERAELREDSERER